TSGGAEACHESCRPLSSPARLSKRLRRGVRNGIRGGVALTCRQADSSRLSRLSRTNVAARVLTLLKGRGEVHRRSEPFFSIRSPLPCPQPSEIQTRCRRNVNRWRRLRRSRRSLAGGA